MGVLLDGIVLERGGNYGILFVVGRRNGGNAWTNMSAGDVAHGEQVPWARRQQLRERNNGGEKKKVNGGEGEAGS